jgi:excisionase family DNA binding protein
MIPNLPRFTVRDIATLFRIQEETVRRWIRRGELEAVRLPGKRAGYHVLHADLARFVIRQFQPGIDEGPEPEFVRKKPAVTDSWSPMLDRIPGLVYIATGDLWTRHVVANGGDIKYQDVSGNWLGCVHPDDREKATGSVHVETADLEYRLIQADKSDVWVSDNAIHAGNGRWYGILRDITAIKKLQQAEERRDAMEALIGQAYDGANVVQPTLELVSGLAGIDRVETIRRHYVRSEINCVDLTIPGRPDSWGVLRLHTTAPEALESETPLLEMAAGAIGVSLMNERSRSRQARWYSTRDIALMLKVQEETVRRWIRREEIQIMTLGSSRAGYRVHPVDLEAFIRERYVHSQPGA